MIALLLALAFLKVGEEGATLAVHILEMVAVMVAPLEIMAGAVQGATRVLGELVEPIIKMEPQERVELVEEAPEFVGVEEFMGALVVGLDFWVKVAVARGVLLVVLPQMGAAVVLVEHLEQQSLLFAALRALGDFMGEQVLCFPPASKNEALAQVAQSASFGPVALGLSLQLEQQTNRNKHGTLHTD